MTDDISKVADRLESATTPAEVGGVGAALRALEQHEWIDRDGGMVLANNAIATTIRTLARQLAEAKALLDGPLPTGHQTFPALSPDHRAAKARCAAKRGSSEDAQAMRLCAEACSAYSLKLGEIGGYYARALHRIAELEQAESALAAATRRVAEVEVALDHIARVGMGSRNKTKRTQWIIARAISALNGDENWRGQKTPHGYHDALEAKEPAK